MHRQCRLRRGVGSRRSGLLVQALERRVVLDSSYFPLSTGDLLQNWENTSLISANDDWSGVPSIEGFRGDGLATATGRDPQTVLAADEPGVLDVNANLSNPNTFGTGGVAEFALSTPIGTSGNNTVALQGSNTARAPYLKFYVDNSGQSGPVAISYDLIDIDGSADNSIQQVALQYRVGTSGNFVNVPAGYVADASEGPSLSGLVNSFNITLPSDTVGAGQVQIRIMTTDAAGTDEWIAIDNIRVYTTSPNFSSFSFNQSAYSVSEGAGAVQLQVLRTGLTTGEASAAYQTLSGTATSGSDFVAGLGRSEERRVGKECWGRSLSPTARLRRRSRSTSSTTPFPSRVSFSLSLCSTRRATTWWAHLHRRK